MCRRLFLIVFLAGLLPSCASAQLTANYNIIVEENGNALIVLVITGIGSINVPLPLDVVSPAVRDALYVQASNGVEVAVDAGGSSTIVYKTALLTARDGDEWRFRLELPTFSAASIILSIPENTNVINTKPNAAISHVGKSKNIIWNVFPANSSSVEATYKFTAPTTPAVSAEPGETVKGDEGSSIIAVFIVLILPLALTLILVYLLFFRKRRRLVLSEEKQNVLKALTGNEIKVVTLLLENRGGMKRNDLERKSGVPKSSLASTLHNLEQRNIVRVNKEYTVHYVELTEWFKSL